MAIQKESDSIQSDTLTCLDETEDSLSTIEFMCEEAEKSVYTPEEAAHWDSMNANGGYMLVRGAERNLDTTVNHLRMIFITEQ